MNDTSDNAIRPSKERYTCLKTVDSHGCGLVFGSWAELKEHEKTHDALPLPWRFEVRNVAIADTGDYDGVIEIRASNGSVVAETWEATNEQEAAFRQIVEEMNRKPPQVETEGALQIERDVYCLALSRLVRKLEEVHEDPRYKAVWESFMIHGGKYTEPTYTEEFESAKKMLRHFQTEPPAMKAGEEQP